MAVHVPVDSNHARSSAHCVIILSLVADCPPLRPFPLHNPHNVDLDRSTARCYMHIRGTLRAPARRASRRALARNLLCRFRMCYARARLNVMTAAETISWGEGDIVMFDMSLIMEGRTRRAGSESLWFRIYIARTHTKRGDYVVSGTSALRDMVALCTTLIWPKAQTTRPVNII